jgi:hypothetical protein
LAVFALFVAMAQNLKENAFRDENDQALRDSSVSPRSLSAFRAAASARTSR